MIAAIYHAIGAYKRGGVIGPASWPHYDIIVVTRGDATFRIKGRDYLCAGGSALLIPPNHEFVGKAGLHGCILWVQHFRFERRKVGKAAKPKEPEHWPGAASDEWARALLRRTSLIQQPSSPHKRELKRVLNLLFETLRLHAGVPQSSGGRLSREMAALVSQIENHPHPLPSIAHFASLAGCSPGHFRDVFRRQHGRSVGQFIRELKMNEAVRLLLQSNLPIKEIGSRLGYSDHVTFHRAFVHFSGTAPGKFRSDAPKIV